MTLTIAEEKQLIAVQKIAQTLPDIAKALTRISDALEKRNGESDGGENDA